MKKKRWLDKPYNNLNASLRETFGEKVIKLSVDGGFSCPNRDGLVGRGGCVFCSEEGSGDFAGSRCKSITDQLSEQIELLKAKWPKAKYIAYFQSYSNTYGDMSHMEKQFQEALSLEGVVGLAIATRADCIDDDVLNLLEQLNKQTYLWVEMGLQSIYQTHHQWLNTGYSPEQFEKTAHQLGSRGIRLVGHIILGLPGAPETEVEDTVDFLNRIPLQGLKVHMLNVLKHTALAQMYEECPFYLLSEEAYINQVVDIIERLKPSIVIHRVTGDGAKSLLVAPRWILNKRKVLNDLQKAFKTRESYQGKHLD